MTSSSIDHDRVVDQVWARSLERIMKGDGPAPVRQQIGDDIDAFIPQVATGMLLSANPAFARILYTAAFSAAKRNSFFAMRRLGMPSDFFWKFDLWSDDRAHSTVARVVDRIFKALLHAGQQGLLEFLKIDVPATRFEIAFENCAECHGVVAERTACFFHAGTFAGIFGAMLDRDLDCVETECTAAGAEKCRFTVGLPNDRDLAARFEENMTSIDVQVNATTRSKPESDADRRLVDIGYYQLLLSSAIAGNLSTLDRTCFETGLMVGDQFGSAATSRGETVSDETIRAIYRELHYLDLAINTSSPPNIVVSTAGAPETAGALAEAAFVPFLAGELQRLLNLAGHDVQFSKIEKRPGSGGLDLVFGPKV